MRLPREASLAGLKVVGFDLAENVTVGLNSGHSHVDTVSNADVAEMVAGGFHATCGGNGNSQAGNCCDLRAHPTVVRQHRDLAAVRGAAQLTGWILRPGMPRGVGIHKLPRGHG